MRTRLVGWIPFGRRLLHQQRDDERRAREQLRPTNPNVEIGPAAVQTPGAPDTRRS